MLLYIDYLYSLYIPVFCITRYYTFNVQLGPVQMSNFFCVKQIELGSLALGSAHQKRVKLPLYL